MTETARRDLLRLAGASTVVFLAGCGNGDEEEPTENEDTEPDDEADDEDWGGVDEFAFEGRVEAWTGLEPEFIDGEENPTITLLEGQEYDFRWVNADGILHNMEIRNEDGDIIEDYQSDDVEEEGEEATIEGVTVTEEMTTYICRYHESTQVGDIEIETE